MTVPVALAAFVPDRVAESVTLVPVGTLIEAPDCVPPLNEVATVVVVRG